MGDRKLYGERSFVIKEIELHKNIWHLCGVFTKGSIHSKYDETMYRVRVLPDPRWHEVHKIAFKEERIYECESMGSVSRRHIYGSGNWYISRYFDCPRSWAPEDKFKFEDFLVLKQQKEVVA